MIPDAIQGIPVTLVPGLNSPKVKIPPGGYQLDVTTGWAIAADVPFDASFGGGILPAHSFVLVDNTTLPGGNNFAAYFSADIYAIDSKMDDGLPLTGSMRAYFHSSDNMFTGAVIFGSSGGIGIGPGGPNAAVCVRNDTSPPQYNVQYMGSAFGGACGAIIKAAF